jgi:hypothetical protein
MPFGHYLQLLAVLRVFSQNAAQVMVWFEAKRAPKIAQCASVCDAFVGPMRRL